MPIIQDQSMVKIGQFKILPSDRLRYFGSCVEVLKTPQLCGNNFLKNRFISLKVIEDLVLTSAKCLRCHNT